MFANNPAKIRIKLALAPRGERATGFLSDCIVGLPLRSAVLVVDAVALVMAAYEARAHPMPYCSGLLLTTLLTWRNDMNTQRLSKPANARSNVGFVGDSCPTGM